MLEQLTGLIQNPQQFQRKFDEFTQNFQKNYGNISPQQMVQNLLNQGKMTQAQFNQYRNMANRITGMNM